MAEKLSKSITEQHNMLLTVIDRLYKSRVVDVASCLINKLAAKQLKIFISYIYCEKVKHASKLQWGDNSSVGTTLKGITTNY